MGWLCEKHSRGTHPNECSECLQGKITRLQSRIDFLEKAFSQFSHEVSLEDLNSGRVGVFTGED